MSCEHCWNKARYPDGCPSERYSAVLRQAEDEGWPCTKNTEEGARLRAGDYWDAERKVDTRTLPATHPPEPRDAE